jgi:hypothetical protein
MLYIGVDPGKLGAIATVDDDGTLRELVPTPMLEGGKLFDLAAIAAFFRTRADPRRPDRGLFVTVEKLQPLPAFRPRVKGAEPEPMGGTVANFNRGVAHGWAWMLAAFRIPHELVRPQEWQRAMLAGVPGTDSKERSIAAAKELWPSASFRRTKASRVDASDLADAALIAEWGRRKHLGGPVFACAVSFGPGQVTVFTDQRPIRKRTE